MHTKIRTLKTYVWSVLLYGCECWTISNNNKKKLEATAMWFIRRLMGISWKERKTNEEVLKLSGTSRSLMKTVRKRQMEFLGHINRKNGLEKIVLCGKIEGKRSRGRPRTSHIASLNAFAFEKKIPNNQCIKLADNRVEWRTMIADACNRPDT